MTNKPNSVPSPAPNLVYKLETTKPKTTKQATAWQLLQLL